MENCGKLRRLGPGSGPRVCAGNGAGVQAGVHAGEQAGEQASAGVAEMRACSGCAGDYEDPDRTAWPPDDPRQGTAPTEHAAADPASEEFPAEEH